MVVFDLLTQRCQNHFSSFTGFFNIQAVAFLQAQESRGGFFWGGVCFWGVGGGGV